MPRERSPRKGSMQYKRKRARRPYPKIRAWSDQKKLLGFAGYKVGMTHIQIKDNNPNSQTKNEIVAHPVTIIECPPLKVFAIRFYEQTPYGLKVLSEIHSSSHEKELKRKIQIPKTPKTEIPKERVAEVRLIVYTQPKLLKLKKKPEIFEIAVKKDSVEETIEFVSSFLNKEIKLTDIFKEGQFIDIHAVTKGKGTQGPVKRFGIALKKHKSEKGRRAPGSLGNWMAKTWRVAHAGQLGFFTRTIYNTKIMQISSDPSLINPKAGFKHYGFVKNEYLLVKGSIPGPAKRLIRFTEPIRNIKPKEKPEIVFIKK